jgi:non-specific serine/threonine protein kinase
MALAREIGNTVGTAGSIIGLGEVALVRGDYPLARALLGEALDLLREVGSKHPQTVALMKLGQAELKDGDHRAAGRSFHSALSLAQESGNRYVLGWILDGVAACAQADGRPERAARLLGFVVALREATGVRLGPEDAQLHEEALAAVRAALAIDTFDNLWAEGRAFTPDEAVAYALQAERRAGKPRRPRDAFPGETISVDAP